MPVTVCYRRYFFGSVAFASAFQSTKKAMYGLRSLRPNAATVLMCTEIQPTIKSDLTSSNHRNISGLVENWPHHERGMLLERRRSIVTREKLIPVRSNSVMSSQSDAEAAFKSSSFRLNGRRLRYKQEKKTHATSLNRLPCSTTWLMFLRLNVDPR